MNLPNYSISLSSLLSIRDVQRLVVGLILILLVACGRPPAPATPTAPPLAEELVYYDWADNIPQSVLGAFTAEYGVKVTYLTFDSLNEAVANIRAGKVYDVVNIGNEYIPELTADSLLADINFQNVPNFKNVSANFRDLAYDPGNRHSVPIAWGITGLIVHRDLVSASVTRWADLWDARFAGKLLLWSSQRELFGIALKSLGYSANSENPTELEAAFQHLAALKPNAILAGYDVDVGLDALTSGEAALMFGWSYDAQLARDANPAITFIAPEEGAFLWGDNYTVPANSSNQYTAELFINFMLRPEIAAQITNANYFATPNEAARPFLDPLVLNDPLIFPANDDLVNAEIILPLSPAGQKLYDDLWARFMAGGQ